MSPKIYAYGKCTETYEVGVALPILKVGVGIQHLDEFVQGSMVCLGPWWPIPSFLPVPLGTVWFPWVSKAIALLPGHCFRLFRTLPVRGRRPRTPPREPATVSMAGPQGFSTCRGKLIPCTPADPVPSYLPGKGYGAPGYKHTMFFSICMNFVSLIIYYLFTDICVHCV